MKPEAIRRRGTMYVAVVGCTMAVTVIGIGALLATRIEARSTDGIMDLTEARLYAQSAIDFGMWTIYNDPNWRTNKASGTWKTDQPIGEGLFSLSVVDSIDGVLGNARSAPVVLTGTGKLRNARYMLEATALAQPVGLKALGTCLHAGGSVTVSLLNSVGLTGAPLSMNGSINGPGTITGNIEAGSSGVTPVINGTSQIPAPAKELPDSGVLSTYTSLAATLSLTEIRDAVLTPNYNPFGATLNSDGVYYVNAGGDFTIRAARIHGTLIIKVPAGKKVRVRDFVFLHPYRADYPTLIIDGDLEIDMASGSGQLSESVQGQNYNPSGAAYQDVTDTDQTDGYPNEIQGLTHVKGNLTILQTSRIRGVILVEGNVTVGGTVQLIHDPTLSSNPPMGYVTYIMQLANGSWRRVVNP